MKSTLATQSFERKASKLWMALFPLVALATITPVKASAVHLDPNNTDSCTVTGSGSCVVMQAGSQPGGNGNLDWLQLSGQGSSQFSNGSYLLEFDANGGSDNNYLPGGPVPVSWDFFVDGTSSINWTVSFTLGLQQDSNSIYPSFTTSGVANPGDELSSAGAIVFAGGGTPIFYDMSIQLTSTSAFIANVPAGSTEDFNPAIAAPEPGSAVLMLAGAAFLALFRKRIAFMSVRRQPESAEGA